MNNLCLHERGDKKYIYHDFYLGDKKIIEIHPFTSDDYKIFDMLKIQIYDSKEALNPIKKVIVNSLESRFPVSIDTNFDIPQNELIEHYLREAKSKTEN